MGVVQFPGMLLAIGRIVPGIPGMWGGKAFSGVVFCSSVSLEGEVQ